MCSCCTWPSPPAPSHGQHAPLRHGWKMTSRKTNCRKLLSKTIKTEERAKYFKSAKLFYFRLFVLKEVGGGGGCLGSLVLTVLKVSPGWQGTQVY